MMYNVFHEATEVLGQWTINSKVFTFWRPKAMSTYNSPSVASFLIVTQVLP